MAWNVISWKIIVLEKILTELFWPYSTKESRKVIIIDRISTIKFGYTQSESNRWDVGTVQYYILLDAAWCCTRVTKVFLIQIMPALDVICRFNKPDAIDAIERELSVSISLSLSSFLSLPR